MREAAEQRAAEREALAIRRETIMATLLGPARILSSQVNSEWHDDVARYVKAAREMADKIMEAARE